MDPASIFTLIVTVSDLSSRLYGFFKALHDAPEEVREYLAVLERIRALFLEVDVYVQEHQQSSFNTLDGICLTIVEKALKDCELEFTLQLTLVQDLDIHAASSLVGRAQRRMKWVLRKETIDGLTRKLEKSQSLLSESIIVSSGRNEIAIRHRLESIGSDIKQALLDREEEAKEERAQLLSRLSQFTHQLESRISFLLKTSQEQGVRNDASLDNLSRQLSIDATSQPGHPLPSNMEPPDGSNSQDERYRQEHASPSGHEGTCKTQEPSPAIAHVDDTAPHEEASVKDNPTDQNIHEDEEAQQTVEQQADPSRPRPSVIPSRRSTTPQPRLPNPMEEAMKNFIRTQPASSLFFDERTSSGRTWAETQRMISEAQGIHNSPEKQSVSRIASKIAKLTNVMSAYTDVLVQTSPASVAVVWGAVRLTMQASPAPLSHRMRCIPGMEQVAADSSEMRRVTEVLEEMADAAETGGREFALYQDPKIHEQLVSLYTTLISLSQLCTKYLRNGKNVLAKTFYSKGFREDLDAHTSEMRKGTAAILREVDYRHRVEMRNSSRQLMEASAEHQKQLVEVNVEQRKISNAVEEQREILECLREERTILRVVHEQQKILQAVQQIELRLREAEGVSCSPAKVAS